MIVASNRRPGYADLLQKLTDARIKSPTWELESYLICRNMLAATKFHEPPYLFVECGTHLGRTSMLLAAFLKESLDDFRIITIEKEIKNFQEASANISRFGLSDLIEPVCADDSEYVFELEDKSIHGLYVDS